jgi:hypothetical protein
MHCVAIISTGEVVACPLVDDIEVEFSKDHAKLFWFPSAFAISICRRPASRRSCFSNDNRAFCCFRLAVSRGPLFSIQPQDRSTLTHI